MGWPTSSSRSYPNSDSVWRLTNRIKPFWSTPTKASGTASRRFSYLIVFDDTWITFDLSQTRTSQKANHQQPTRSLRTWESSAHIEVWSAEGSDAVEAKVPSSVCVALGTKNVRSIGDLRQRRSRRPGQTANHVDNLPLAPARTPKRPSD